MNLLRYFSLLALVMLTFDSACQTYCKTDSIFGVTYGQMQWKNQAVPLRRIGSTYVIPTVVHVVHQNGVENISDAQVLSQIDVLNADFRRLNADTVNTYPPFRHLAADVGVEFCLARIDPGGNPTTGINRIYSTTSGSLAMISQFGWDNKRYMNIYVSSHTGCFSSFPWSPDNEDGIFVTHGRFGTTGTAGTEQFAEFSTLGRTTTHEVGHYLGLYHTFSFNSCDTACLSGDSICDTPPVDLRWWVGPCYHQLTNTCFETPDLPDMVDNFMDYNIDSCMNMFTEGQKQRILSSIPTYREFLVSDSNLVLTGCDSISLGIGTPDERGLVSVFPNPSGGRLTISSVHPIRHIELYTLQGELLMSINPHSNDHTLDTGSFAAGLYLVKVISDENFFFRRITITSGL